MDLQHWALTCAKECERQKVGPQELVNLMSVYQNTRRASKLYVPGFTSIIQMATQIEPRNDYWFRRIPVTFANGGSAVAPTAVEGAFRNWLEHIGEDWSDAYHLHHYIKSFLNIHPFEDGNGRIAFILYNWLNKSLERPYPLPEYNFS